MENKPKILFILYLPPPVHGAAMVGKYIKESKIINEKFDCYYINESLSETVEQVGKKKGKFFALYKHFKNIKKSLKDIKPDMVYVTSGGGDFSVGQIRYSLEIRLIRKYCNKIVIHLHNKGNNTHIDKWYSRWCYRMLLQNTNVIYLSKYLSNTFLPYKKYYKEYICHNGVPQINQNVFVEERTNEIPNILFLSNILISKGAIVLLDALKILKDNNIKFICNYVGSESQEISKEQFLNEIKERELSEQVIYHGPKYGNEKIQYFRKSDIFVFPTYYHCECFPLVLLEALQFKLPVVSTTEGGIKDIIVDNVNGYTIESRKDNGKPSASELADRLTLLINDRNLRKRMGLEGYKFYLEKFTLEHFEKNMADCLLNIYSSDITSI